jgi:hypothetical protein
MRKEHIMYQGEDKNSNFRWNLLGMHYLNGDFLVMTEDWKKEG